MPEARFIHFVSHFVVEASRGSCHLQEGGGGQWLRHHHPGSCPGPTQVLSVCRHVPTPCLHHDPSSASCHPPSASLSVGFSSKVSSSWGLSLQLSSTCGSHLPQSLEQDPHHSESLPGTVPKLSAPKRSLLCCEMPQVPLPRRQCTTSSPPNNT